MLTLEFWCLPVVGGGVLILKNSAYLLNKVHKVWYVVQTISFGLRPNH